MSYKIKAVYRDAAGNQFSAEVIRTVSGWRLNTANGERPIDYFIPETTAAGGMLMFEDYAIRTNENLRGCDFIQKVNAIRSLLPWPVQPANPPSVHSEPQDARIHIETAPAIPTTESSFARLKAAGNRAAAEYRANRERERRELQENLSRPDPRTAQQSYQARQQRNEIAALKRRG